MEAAFNPQILSKDLLEVRRIYADFFAGVTGEDWVRPVKGGPREWNLHEVVAHLCALSGAGLESVECTLAGKPYVFDGLATRYDFNAFNQRGIERHRALPQAELCAEFLGILDRAAAIAADLAPEQAGLASEMPIYNRPVKIVEALSIIMFHAGLHHSAQVTEPAGVPPLWRQLEPETRRRVITRVMRALSLLYRSDLGGDLRAAFQFRMAGPGGGNWFVSVSPEGTASGEGLADQPGLTLALREPGVFCKLFTGRLNLLAALLKGELRLQGSVRLFPRFGALFSVDARA